MGKSIWNFVVEHRSLNKYCCFSAFLDDMLRDKLVEINDDRVQRRLLANKDTMTFQEAFNIAVCMESTSKNLLDIYGKSKIEVNNVYYENKQPLKPKPCVSKQENDDECYIYGGSHNPSKCNAIILSLGDIYLRNVFSYKPE